MIKRPKQVERSQKSYLTNERYQDFAENQFKTIYDYLDGIDQTLEYKQEEIDNIYKKNTYSTEELKIGIWQGKPLYRKIIPLESSDFGLGTATQATAPTIAHNISDISYIVNSDFIWKRTTDTTFRKFPSVYAVDISNWAGQMFADATYLKFELGTTITNNLRNNGTLMYAILEYTKTTD